jgi:hypothetical protein
VAPKILVSGLRPAPERYIAIAEIVGAIVLQSYTRRLKRNGGHHTREEWLLKLATYDKCPGCHTLGSRALDLGNNVIGNCTVPFSLNAC